MFNNPCMKACENKNEFGYCKTTACINPSYNGSGTYYSNRTEQTRPIYNGSGPQTHPVYNGSGPQKTDSDELKKAFFIWWSSLGATIVTRYANNFNIPILIFTDDKENQIGFVNDNYLCNMFEWGVPHKIEDLIV